MIMRSRFLIWRGLRGKDAYGAMPVATALTHEREAEAGVPTPLTARVVSLIHEIERGARPRSLDTLAATPHAAGS